MESQSEHINELAAALAKAQSEMKHAGKDSENPFFKSKYSDLAACLDASRPALTANGLSVSQGSIVSGGTMVLRTMLIHSSGQWLSAEYPIDLSDRPAGKDKDGNAISRKVTAQDIGSCITYARRYAYQAIICAASSDDPDDDDGNGASGRGHTQDVAPTRATDSQVNRINSLMSTAVGLAPEWGPSVLTKANVSRWDRLTSEQAAKVIEALLTKQPKKTTANQAAMNDLAAVDEEAAKKTESADAALLPDDPTPEILRLLPPAFEDALGMLNSQRHSYDAEELKSRLSKFMRLNVTPRKPLSPETRVKLWKSIISGKLDNNGVIAE